MNQLVEVIYVVRNPIQNIKSVNRGAISTRCQVKGVI